ncbi:MAG: 2-amino-4-hydroxy-6-hydroxymethyldihydropteridine diphosphokinase [Thermanaerothrix sp.]|uniref:2-amino-4-hydroxy-6- hydroxymethyldihydropteridine diphosphokinase n=1 Tax=Thermanaerothrix sp. TaxID=2972675 RepID=UPI003C7A877A
MCTEANHGAAWVTVYLALGTNLGDRLANLRRALAALPPEVQPLRVSAVYETPPWGITEQPRFLNMVVEARTRLEPLPLLHYLKTLERQLGRQPGVRYGPRLIDLDILLYGDMVINLPELTVPHPRMAERAFVLVPLCDLYPQGRHPLLNETFEALRARVDCREIEIWAEAAAVWPQVG